MRRQQPVLDGFGTERRREESRGTRGMANVGCQVVWCPNGPQDYGIARFATHNDIYRLYLGVVRVRLGVVREWLISDEAPHLMQNLLTACRVKG